MCRRSLISSSGTVALAVALAASACDRKPNAPELQTTTGQLPRSEPVTVSGCLRAGLGGENTFVLMTAESEPTPRTATYQLTGPGLNLEEYAGQRVKVSGTVRAEEQFSSNGTTSTGKPVGTGGTPSVKSKTELDVKQMTVTSIDRTGERCAPPLPSAER
jgi:hypothetical protein